MFMAEDIKLAENIIIVDVEALNQTVTNLLCFLENTLHRNLNKIDLETWIVDLALDAGLRDGGHKTQILFVSDNDSVNLEHFKSGNLKALDGWGCRNQFGEFIISAISSEGLTSRESVYLDLLQIILNSKDVKRVVVVPSDDEYGERLSILLENAKQFIAPESPKNIVRFFSVKPGNTPGYKGEILIYSLMHALGIRSEDLDLIH
jgi:hypothetical protein